MYNDKGKMGSVNSQKEELEVRRQESSMGSGMTN
jgi:hypothetical protein